MQKDIDKSTVTSIYGFIRLVGCPPFWHRKQMVMLRNIMDGKYSFTSPEWSDITGESNTIPSICKCWDHLYNYCQSLNLIT